MARKIQDCEYFLGIDIGSFETKIVLSRVQSLEAQTLEVLEAFSCITQGLVEKGSITDIDKLALVLNETIHSHLASLDGQYIFTTFSMKNSSIQSKINKVKNPFSRRKREVTDKDLRTARLMANNSSLEDGKEYIDSILRQYTVDGRYVQKNPVGHVGTSVEAELLLISTDMVEINKYKKCINKLTINLDSLCIDSLAASEPMLTEDEKEKGVILFDIGAQSVSVAWYEHGSPKSVVVVPFGIDDISKDIQNELNISISLARKIVNDYACLDLMYLSELNSYEEVHTEDGAIKCIDTKLIYQISYARILDIFVLAYQLLNLKDNIESYSVVITGGGARLRGITSLVEIRMRTRVRLAQPSNWGGPIQIYRSPNYGVAIGLCVNGVQRYYQNNKSSIEHRFVPEKYSYSSKEQTSSLWRWISKIGKFIKNFFSLGTDSL